MVNSPWTYSIRADVAVSPPPWRGWPLRCSRQQTFHDLAADVGQSEISALESVGQLGVIEAEQVEDRGVKVVDMHPVLDDAEAEIIGLPVGDPGLDAAAGHPHREGVGMVV